MHQFVRGCGLIVMAIMLSGAQAAFADTPTYVFNTYGEEEGRSEQRPPNLVLSEFTVMRDITWHSWGSGRATGSGKVSGTWCLPACQETPYNATLTLSDVRWNHFTSFTVTGDFPMPESPRDTLVGHLPTP